MNTAKEVYSNNVDYFTRIPNEFIQKNLSAEYGLNRIFLIIYIFIDRNRTYEDLSHISIGDILRRCGYKITRRKPKLFYEIIKCLLFLKENCFIDTSFNLYSIGYDDLIQIKIISKNFDAQSNFTKLYGKDLDTILNSESTLNKENILVAFLYINSYIGCRKRNEDGSEKENAKEYPEAFFKSIKHMSEELAMSKDTINQCIEYLTTSSETHNALLIKREVGSVQPDKTKPPQNIPNIYVLNKKGYELEIKWALQKITQLYDTDEFHPFVKGNNQKIK